MLIGSVISLRQPLEKDIGLRVALRNDPDLQHSLMAAARPNTPERVHQWLESRLNDRRTLFFIVADRAGDEALGYVQLKDMDPLHGHAELGICLSESARGTGAAPESLRLLFDYARDTFRMHKVILRVLASNDRAIAFYEKVGFRRVGVFNEHYYYQRRFHDVLLMEKLLKDSSA